MKNNNVIFSTRSELYALFFSSYYFFHHHPSAKKKKKMWKFRLEVRKRRYGVCNGEVVACVSGVEERKKGVRMGREIALTLPSPFLCLLLSQAKELDIICRVIPSVQHFRKLFLYSILIRDCSKHIDKTYLQQSKALKEHSVDEFVHGLF